MSDEMEAIKRSIVSAMGCLSPVGPSADERLAWHRLNGALKGEAPRSSLSEYDPFTKLKARGSSETA